MVRSLVPERANSQRASPPDSIMHQHLKAQVRSPDPKFKKKTSVGADAVLVAHAKAQKRAGSAGRERRQVVLATAETWSYSGPDAFANRNDGMEGEATPKKDAYDYKGVKANVGSDSLMMAHAKQQHDARPALSGQERRCRAMG